MSGTMEQFIKGNKDSAVDSNTESVESIEKKASDLALELTGLDFSNFDLLRERCKEIQDGIVEKYGLPPSELMRPGHQQEYLDQIMKKIDEANIKVLFKPMDVVASYNPDSLYFEKGIDERRQYSSVITINPEQVNTSDGNKICPLLASMYIYTQFSREAAENGNKLNGDEMKKTALMGSWIINDGDSSVKNMFKAML